ncbi:unnamed protein product [Polarella glacialis]|uniref:Class II aldolase/adducin N-terminal domain-containing protein n=1 Tax=Polarella glacialis TaxID=89957 RepID=A0A813KS97_POLGL|nr:unnamed protein product [Polarella glacialis]
MMGVLWALLFLPLGRAEATFTEIANFGKMVATGLCKLPGLDPIVSFPKWGSALLPDQPKFALAVMHSSGGLTPFHGLRSMEDVDDGDPRTDLVSIQALHCPQSGTEMWILDSGKGIGDPDLAHGAAKLIRVRVRENGLSGRVLRVYTFPKDVVTGGSYLNDVRTDGRGFAYITDSNLGHILVLNLYDGKVLPWADMRMKAHLEAGEKFEVDGKDLSSKLQVPVDGIAYSEQDDMLYWKPVTRSSLYRVPAGVLRNAHRLGFDVAVEGQVEDVGKLGFHDGLDADSKGNVYLTDLANGAIQRRSADGKVSWVSEKGAMSWPDCVIASEDAVYVLTTQVHLMPFLNDGVDLRKEPNKLLRVQLGAAKAKGKLEAVLEGRSGFPAAMPPIPTLTVPEELAVAARILAAAGLALDVAGHITAMIPGGSGHMWSTPYGIWWRDVTSADILAIDADGNVVEGSWDVTPAVAIHTELHRARADAAVIIHGHPYYGSLLSAMHEIPEIAEQQAIMFDGDIALFHEYTGGIDNPADGQRLASAVGNATAIILANHGVMITGESVPQAVYRAVTFERTCRLHFDMLAAGRRPVPVPQATRQMLKRSLNTLSVDNFWRGEVRHLLRSTPDLIGRRGASCAAEGNCPDGV